MYTNLLVVLPAFFWTEVTLDIGLSPSTLIVVLIAAVHIDASSVRVWVTCEFHSYEQFCAGSVFIRISKHYISSSNLTCRIMSVFTMGHTQ